MKKLFNFCVLVAILLPTFCFSQSVTMTPGVTGSDDIVTKNVYVKSVNQGSPLCTECSIADHVFGLKVLQFRNESGMNFFNISGEDLKNTFPGDMMPTESGEVYLRNNGLLAAMVDALKVLKDDIGRLKEENRILSERVTGLEAAVNQACKEARVRVTDAVNNPTSKTLIGNKTAPSSPMLVHAFAIKVESQRDITLATLPLRLTLTEVAGGTATIPSSDGYGLLYSTLIEDVWIEIDGHRSNATISNYHISTTGGLEDTEINVINFNMGDITIRGESTVEAKIYIKLAPLPDNGTNPNANSGVMIASAVTGRDLIFKAGGYCAVPQSSISGGSTGYGHIIRTAGVVVTKGVSTNRIITKDINGNVTKIGYSIPITMQAFGDDYYVGQTVQHAATVSGTNAFAISLQTSAAPNAHATLPTGYLAETTISLNAPVVGSGFYLQDGTTRSGVIEVTLVGDATAFTTSYRAAMNYLQLFTNPGLSAGGIVIKLVPVENYRTDYQLID